jgi:membrane protein
LSDKRKGKGQTMAALINSWGLIREAVSDWVEDNAPRMGAALAFYSILSLAPLLLIALAIAGLFFDQADARGQLIAQVRELIGVEGSKAVEAMLTNETGTGRGIAAVLGIATLIFGASGVFGELQSSMNAVWDVRPKATGIWEMIRARFLSFAMVLGTGFLLLISLIMSTVIAGFHKRLSGAMPQFEWLWQGLSVLVTLTIVTLLFAMIYKFLPDAKVPWRDVWLGAIITAVLFAVGKIAIGLYLGKSGLASSYGAAGSLVVLIVWVYYSAQILLFGAEITHAMSQRDHGNDPAHSPDNMARAQGARA